MRKAKAQPWKKISSKSILDYNGVKLDEDIVKLPNGKKITYIRRSPGEPDAVIIIALNDKRQILLQKEYSYPPNAILWQLPGGSMKVGEDIIKAANRELAEESGYEAKDCRVIGFFYANNRNTARKQHIVVCSKLTKHVLPADEDEFIDSFWINIDQLDHYIKNGEFTNINLLAALNVWAQFRGE